MKLYSCLAEYEGGVLLLARIENMTVGFICGVASEAEFQMHFLKKHFFDIIPIVASRIFSFHALKKMFDILLYPSLTRKSLPEAELLSMAVRDKFTKQNIGSMLFGRFVTEMRKMGVSEFKILVGSELFTAQEFYKKMGCMEAGYFDLHTDKKSLIYIKKT